MRTLILLPAFSLLAGLLLSPAFAGFQTKEKIEAAENGNALVAPLLYIISGNYPQPTQEFTAAQLAPFETGQLESSTDPFVYDGAAAALVRAARYDEALAVLDLKANRFLVGDTVTEITGDSLLAYRTFVNQAVTLLLSGRYHQSWLAYHRALRTNSAVYNSDVFWEMKLAEYLDVYHGQDSLPLYPHFNGGFGQFLRDAKDFQFGMDEIAAAITAMAGLIRDAGGSHPVILEATGDLLVQYRADRSMKYLCAFSYFAAAKAMASKARYYAYERKALFAMEKEVRHPEYYNIARFHAMRKAWEAELESPAWQPAGTPYKGQAIIAFWPDDENSPAMAFANEHATYEMQNSGEIPTNDDFVNPAIDPAAVKSTVSYNLYALLVIFTLIGTIVLMYVMWRKREREIQAADEG